MIRFGKDLVVGRKLIQDTLELAGRDSFAQNVKNSAPDRPVPFMQKQQGPNKMTWKKVAPALGWKTQPVQCPQTSGFNWPPLDFDPSCLNQLNTPGLKLRGFGSFRDSNGGRGLLPGWAGPSMGWTCTCTRWLRRHSCNS